MGETKRQTLSGLDQCPDTYNPNQVDANHDGCEDEQGGGTGGDIQLAELHIYGRSRLGMMKPDGVTMAPEENRVSHNVDVELAEHNSVYVRRVNRKQYELTDYLGNVRVVITDVKTTDVVQNDKPHGPYKATLLASNNYYPFGMLQPERHWSTEEYRYGYNGKEMDNEASGNGNQYDYGFRIYNPRIARFLSVDPLQSNYPHASPYNYVENNPISRIDVDGRAWGCVNVTIKKDRNNNNAAYITISFTAVLIVPSDNLDDNDKNKLRDRIQSVINEAFTNSFVLIKKGDNPDEWRQQLSEDLHIDIPPLVHLKMNADVRIVKDRNEAKSGEHIFTIFDPTVETQKLGSGEEAEYLGDDIGISEARLYNILYGADARTVIHGVGHTGGLLHPDGWDNGKLGQFFTPGTDSGNFNSVFNAMYKTNTKIPSAEEARDYIYLNTTQYFILLQNILQQKVNNTKSQKVPGSTLFSDH